MLKQVLRQWILHQPKIEKVIDEFQVIKNDRQYEENTDVLQFNIDGEIMFTMHETQAKIPKSIPSMMFNG